MNILDLYPGGFASCCYLLTEGADAVLIDCSAPEAAVAAALQEQHATLRAILCTHGHFDHILTADALRERFAVPLYLHEADAEMLTDSNKNAFTTFFGYSKEWRPAEHIFADGDLLRFGAISLTVRHTPGHSMGSSLLLGNGVAFTGDTIFANGFGRADLYGGSQADLYRSLRALQALPRGTVIYPGHGESTTLGDALDRIF